MHQKKAISAGRPKKEKLGSTSSFIHFPLQIQQAFSLSSPFLLTTAMALDTAASLSFLLLCLKIMPTVWREKNLKQVQEKNKPKRISTIQQSTSIFICDYQQFHQKRNRELLFWPRGIPAGALKHGLCYANPGGRKYFSIIPWKILLLVGAFKIKTTNYHPKMSRWVRGEKTWKGLTTGGVLSSNPRGHRVGLSICHS